MDRREFLGLSGGAAATTAIKAAHVGAGIAEPESFAKMGRALRATLGGQSGNPDSDPITVSVSSEFMEDYTVGTPFTGSFSEVEVPFIARTGNLQLLSFSGIWNGASPETAIRVYADPDPEKYPDKDSMTGWSMETTPFPPPIQYQRPSMAPPRALLIPGWNGGPDMLWAYRDRSMLLSSVNDDGSLGFIRMMQITGNEALVKGPLPKGTRYIPEQQTGSNCFHEAGPPPPGCFNGPGLRDITSLRLYPIDQQSLYSSVQTSQIRRVFPLSSPDSNVYAAIALEDNGNVTAFRLALDTSNYANQVFRIQSKVVVAHSSSSCVNIIESQPGVAEVFLFDLPNVQTFMVNVYDPMGKISVKPVSNTTLPNDHMPVFPGGSDFSVFTTINADAQAVEAILVIREPIPHEDGVSKADPLAEIWTTSRNAKGVWETPMLLDKGIRFATQVAAPEVTLCVSRPRTGFEFLIRNADGDWDSNHVRVESENGEMLECAGYRVGITLKRDKLIIPGGEFGLVSTVACGAIVSGRHGTLGIHRPWQAAPDHTGTLWVTVLLEDRTSFPQLVVSSNLFTDRLVLNLNHRIEDHLANVTPDQLLSARDPRHCTEEELDGCTPAEIAAGLDVNGGKAGITDPDKAKTAATVITKSLAAAPKGPNLDPISGDFKVESKIPYGWLPVSSDLSKLRPVKAAYHGPSWRMYFKEGKPQIELISSDEAKAHIVRLTSTYPAYAGAAFGPFDFLSDAIDSIGDLAHSAYDGFVDFAKAAGEAIIDGAMLAIQVTIDGITWVYHAVMDTLDMIMDAIDFVLEYAGMALGMAIGWLLEQLGFLFDWKAIKRRRDDLKSFITANLRPALNKVGNPVDGAASIKKKMVSVKADIFAALNTARSTPADPADFLNAGSQGESMPSLNFISGFSVLPELTWLLDKLQPVLPKMRGGFDFPSIPNLDTQIAALGKVVLTIGSSLSSIYGDVITLFDQWVLQGKILTEAAFDPIIDLLIKLIGRMIDAFTAVLDAAAQLLQSMWQSAGDILKSLDSALPLPAFFRGFYKGLMGNTASAFDIVCLLAAIPGFAEATEKPVNSAAVLSPGRGLARSAEPHLEYASLESHRAFFALGGKDGNSSVSTARVVATLFSVMSDVLAGLSAGFSAQSRNNDPLGLDKMADTFTIGGFVAKGCFYIAELIDDQDPWVIAGGGGLITIAGGILGFAYLKDKDWVKGKVGSGKETLSEHLTPLLILAAAVEFLLGGVEFIADSADEGMASFVSALQFLLSAGIRERRPFPPVQSALLGLAQGGLNGAGTAIYAFRPFTG